MSDILMDLLPDGCNALSVMDKDILAIYGVIKAKYPDAYVNALNGKRINNWCGWRPNDCRIGAAKSAHKQGKALDLHCSNLKELREWIAKNGHDMGITRMESVSATPTWIHIDIIPLTFEQTKKTERIVRGIYIFNP